jgi:hypothetical protein
MTTSRLLAHGIEEESGDLFTYLYIWTTHYDWEKLEKQLNDSKIALWKAMEHRALVRRECCEEVCPKQFT